MLCGIIAPFSYFLFLYWRFSFLRFSLSRFWSYGLLHRAIRRSMLALVFVSSSSSVTSALFPFYATTSHVAECDPTQPLTLFHLFCFVLFRFFSSVSNTYMHTCIHEQPLSHLRCTFVVVRSPFSIVVVYFGLPLASILRAYRFRSHPSHFCVALDRFSPPCYGHVVSFGD